MTDEALRAKADEIADFFTYAAGPTRKALGDAIFTALRETRDAALEEAATSPISRQEGHSRPQVQGAAEAMSDPIERAMSALDKASAGLDRLEALLRQDDAEMARLRAELASASLAAAEMRERTAVEADAWAAKSKAMSIESQPMSHLVLSLFPGIGLLDMAFEEAGFVVVRGPDLLWGGDIRAFHPPAGKFEGVIGGPPCQIFSRMRHINPRAGEAHGNMIPEFERCIAEATPNWFLMENVPEAPEPKVAGYEIRPELVRDVWVGGETKRMRRFSFGTREGRRLSIDTLALHTTEPMQAALAGGARRVPVKLGGSGKIKASRRVCAGDLKTVEGFEAACRAQGLPADFDLPPFTVAAKVKAVGNGVPLAMGRAIAAAVARAVLIKERRANKLGDDPFGHGEQAQAAADHLDTCSKEMTAFAAAIRALPLPVSIEPWVKLVEAAQVIADWSADKTNGEPDMWPRLRLALSALPAFAKKREG